MLVEQHVAGLQAALAMTPYEDQAHGELTMTTVSKMQLVLPSKESGELAGEAKGEAYMAALEDVPSWAVQEAMRKWHRSEYGPKYDYKWQPGPSTLRELAMIETYRVMGVRRRLNDLLLAEPLIEFTPEQEAAMKSRVAEFLKMRVARSPSSPQTHTRRWKMLRVSEKTVERVAIGIIPSATRRGRQFT